MLNKEKTIFFLITLVFCSLAVLALDDDYKVIKNAVDGTNSAISDAKLSKMMFNIDVVDLKSQKPKVKVRIPVRIVTEFMSMCPDEMINIDGHKKINFRQVLQMIKETGSSTLIEIEDSEENEYVKIWIE